MKDARGLEGHESLSTNRPQGFDVFAGSENFLLATARRRPRRITHGEREPDEIGPSVQDWKQATRRPAEGIGAHARRSRGSDDTGDEGRDAWKTGARMGHGAPALWTWMKDSRSSAERGKVAS